MTLASRNEGGVDDWFLEDVVCLHISEVLDSIVHVGGVQLDVLFSNQPISPCPVAFMGPKSDNVQ